MNIAFEFFARSRRWHRRQVRAQGSRRYNFPPETPPSGGPAPAATSPPPASSTPTPAPSSTGASGTSGLPTPGATPASAAPAPASFGTPTAAPVATPAAPGVPATPAPDFQQQFTRHFQQQFGMDPQQARMLMTMGYQQYTGAQRQPQPQPAAQQQVSENVFGLPQFDYKLLDFVSKDPSTGQLMLLPGAPPDAAIRVQAFQDQLRQVQQRFFENPMQFLEKPIAELAEKRARELYTQEFGQHQSQDTARRILAENESWLFARDAQGQMVSQFDPATGRDVRVLSPWGQFYQQCIQQVSQSGVRDTNAQHTMAMQMVENAALRAKLQGSQQPNNPAAQQFLNTQATSPPPAPAPAAPAPAPAGPQAGAVPFSIKDRMRQLFEANGIDDRAVAQQLSRNGAA